MLLCPDTETNEMIFTHTFSVQVCSLNTFSHYVDKRAPGSIHLKDKVFSAFVPSESHSVTEVFLNVSLCKQLLIISFIFLHHFLPIKAAFSDLC